MTHRAPSSAILTPLITPKSNAIFQVSHLYRHSLRCLLSWCIDRDIFNAEATKIRARFDENRGATAAAASRLLQEGRDELFYYTHPDPYKVPFMPGGTKFMRNPPLPISICFPDPKTIPADAPRYTLNPDMSYVLPGKTDSGRNSVGSTLVDFYKKNME
jgi:NADH dehydrogenase (ubiquinone) 1 beta subcomplex subunit 9